LDVDGERALEKQRLATIVVRGARDIGRTNVSRLGRHEMESRVHACKIPFRIEFTVRQIGSRTTRVEQTNVQVAMRRAVDRRRALICGQMNGEYGTLCARHRTAPLATLVAGADVWRKDFFSLFFGARSERVEEARGYSVTVGNHTRAATGHLRLELGDGVEGRRRCGGRGGQLASQTPISFCGP
jgi:hypothetical protein